MQVSSCDTAVRSGMPKRWILMYNRDRNIAELSMFPEVLSSHLAIPDPGYLSSWKTNPPGGRQVSGGEKGENAHYYCIYHFRTEKEGEESIFSY